MCFREKVTCSYSPQKKKGQLKRPPTETEVRRNWSVNYIHPLQKVHMSKQAGPRVTVLDFPCGPAPFSHEITLKKNQRRCQELHSPIDYSHGFKRESWAFQGLMSSTLNNEPISRDL